MKKYISFLSIILILPLFLLSKSIPEKDALKVANKWLKKKYNKNAEILDIYTETYINSTSLYIFNYTNGGFVIVSADDRINPVLGYSETGFLKPDSTNEAITSLLNSYKEKIDFVKNNKSDKNNKNTLKKWNDLFTDSNPEVITKSATLSVPSLFETEQTSRWATWDGYNIVFPGQNGTNSCVPTSMAQICKYHRHPKQGTGTNSYYVNSHFCYVDYSQNLYNYDLMPFRLTYCGNGGENCDEGSFNFLPGITTENKIEISKLIYDIGLGVGMQWDDYTSDSGTYGPADLWADVFSAHLGYKSTWTHWTNTEIHANPVAFKTAMKDNLNNGLPIHFRVGNHAIVIDGYEGEMFFHGAYGRGGYTDGYYYLFNSDDDGIHLTLPSSTSYEAILDIEPDFSFPENLDITTTISSNTIKCYQSINSISISSTIEGFGSGGANISIYSKEVVLDAGFEIEKGATLYINNEDY